MGRLGVVRDTAFAADCVVPRRLPSLGAERRDPEAAIWVVPACAGLATPGNIVAARAADAALRRIQMLPRVGGVTGVVRRMR
jgi:hypothetical protein